MKVRVTLVTEYDGNGFHAYCAELTSVHTDGNTKEDAFRRIRQGVNTHLQAMGHIDIHLPSSVMEASPGRQPSRRLCVLEVRADRMEYP